MSMSMLGNRKLNLLISVRGLGILSSGIAPVAAIPIAGQAILGTQIAGEIFLAKSLLV